MEAIPFTEALANLASITGRVCENREPVIITRDSDQAAVMISLEDYKALEETAYLLGNPANASRLLSSIAELEDCPETRRNVVE